MADKAKEIQGQDPKGNVYADLNPILYSAETPVSGAYVLSSWACALYADALAGGLRGKDVLDLGCGYGTTTSVLANFAPRKIVAVDSAPAMTGLMQKIMLGDLNALENWLEGKDAREVLGDLFEQTVEHYHRRRQEFDEGIFNRHGGKLLIETMSSLKLSPEIGQFDVAVGNNFLHWPVNQRKAELKKLFPDEKDSVLTLDATVDALIPIASALKSGGVAVLMEPKDFMAIDTDQEWEKDLDSHTFVSQSVFRKFHGTFNKLLKERHGIDRAIPTTSGLFLASRLPALCLRAGLRLKRIAHFEMAWDCEPISSLYVRLPLVLGGVNIPFKDKISLGKATMEEMRRTVTKEEMSQLMRVQYFYLLLKKA